jgi:hypothetical protein
VATYYVDGTNGNDAYDGTSPTFVSGSTGPKKTLTAMEAKPVAAGDLVHVRPGTYRETLTCGVSGTVGNAIEYRGDYAGVIWAGGGVVRVTGSNNDLTATRANNITATSKNYRTFTGFCLDTVTSKCVLASSVTDWTIQKCFVVPGLANGWGIQFDGATQARYLVTQCCLFLDLTGIGVYASHSVTVNDAAHILSNCVAFLARDAYLAGFQRVGGGSVKNCTTFGGGGGVSIFGALAAGQTITVNNCLLDGGNVALQATATGEITEDYNNIFAFNTARSNTAVGTHSTAYATLFDPRWAFQLMYATAANQVVSPFDLASYSQLINLAGTSPTTTDLRGTSVIGGTREWGALEYDSSLKIQGGSGGAVSIGPSRRGLGG